MNTNNGVKWRRFIVPTKIEQINENKLNKLIKRSKSLNAATSFELTMALGKLFHTETQRLKKI